MLLLLLLPHLPRPRKYRNRFQILQPSHRRLWPRSSALPARARLLVHERGLPEGIGAGLLDLQCIGRGHLRGWLLRDGAGEGIRACGLRLENMRLLLLLLR